MKFRIISDVHNEFYTDRGAHQHFELPVLEGEENMCLLMAGDIGLLHSPKTYETFVQEMCSRHKRVFWIEGNHEFYHGNISKLSIANLSTKWNNLHTRILDLENEKIVVLGCTLWTNFDDGNPITLLEANQRMNDHHVIRKGVEYSKFKAEDARALHHVQTRQLFKDIEHYKNLNYTVIVVTHHHPTFVGVSKQYIGDLLNGAYCSDLSKEISKHKPDYWICGHIHEAKEYTVHDTTVICNPLGYPHELSVEFNAFKTIEI